MRVVVAGDRSSTYGGVFTGRVELEMLNATESDDEPDTALVHFADGAVTNWHHHPGGQLLYVAAGRGRVGTEADGAVTLEQGTLVVAAPSERHWHGATPGDDCTLLCVTWGTTCWTDEAPDLGD